MVSYLQYFGVEVVVPSRGSARRYDGNHKMIVPQELFGLVRGACVPYKPESQQDTVTTSDQIDCTNRFVSCLNLSFQSGFTFRSFSKIYNVNLHMSSTYTEN